MHMSCDLTPKRGDLVQTNVGDKRERTCFILRASRGRAPRRFNVWAARWWELEPDFRMRLFRSAERRPEGQQVFDFVRFRRPAPKKQPVDLFQE